MKKILFLPLAILMVTQPGCDEKCKKTEAPQVEFGLIIGGTIEFRDYNTRNVITSEFEGKELNLMLKKVYCNGTVRGPFEEKYTVGSGGVLWRNSGGYWSFKLNNLDDYMDIDLFYNGSELCQTALYYSELQSYDGTTAYFEYKILIEWDRAGGRADSGEMILQ